MLHKQGYQSASQLKLSCPSFCYPFQYQEFSTRKTNTKYCNTIKRNQIQPPKQKQGRSLSIYFIRNRGNQEKKSSLTWIINQSIVLFLNQPISSFTSRSRANTSAIGWCGPKLLNYNKTFDFTYSDIKHWP